MSGYGIVEFENNQGLENQSGLMRELRVSESMSRFEIALACAHVVGMVFDSRLERINFGNKFLKTEVVVFKKRQTGEELGIRLVPERDVGIEWTIGLENMVNKKFGNDAILDVKPGLIEDWENLGID